MSEDIWNLPQRDLWDEKAAQSYEDLGSPMYSPEVLGPTVETLAGLAAGGRALELAVGTGRVAIPLREHGTEVHGIELSPAMIAELRTRMDADQLPVTEGSMVDVRVDGEFSLVYLVFNTISNLYSQAEQVACFRNAAAHLGPGGRFVIELWVPRPQPVGSAHAQVFSTGEGYIGMDVLDLSTQRGVSHHIRYEPDGAARVSFSPFRYVWPGELDLMAELAGMELEHRWADFSQAPFTSESTSHVSVYRLR
ncbi:class I SAM-dependent DNA methyltransferase [Pseudactinotalea suaedae]|uniref:class I SAM-dependent DNA methyltransferase n=1 Tax=Pseudactinotalea suaedae TaxID=1524924 RepID=UPI0012E0D64E|nr:class I SAM-dependent methyltransferase [Pseudactinotalea suaedae]